MKTCSEHQNLKMHVLGDSTLQNLVSPTVMSRNFTTSEICSNFSGLKPYVLKLSWILRVVTNNFLVSKYSPKSPIVCGFQNVYMLEQFTWAGIRRDWDRDFEISRVRSILARTASYFFGIRRKLGHDRGRSWSHHVHSGGSEDLDYKYPSIFLFIYLN